MPKSSWLDPDTVEQLLADSNLELGRRLAVGTSTPTSPPASTTILIVDPQFPTSRPQTHTQPQSQTQPSTTILIAQPQPQPQPQPSLVSTTSTAQHQEVATSTSTQRQQVSTTTTQQQQVICCQAYTAVCEACKQGLSVAQFCEDMAKQRLGAEEGPYPPGCPGESTTSGPGFVVFAATTARTSTSRLGSGRATTTSTSSSPFMSSTASIAPSTTSMTSTITTSFLESSTWIATSTTSSSWGFSTSSTSNGTTTGNTTAPPVVHTFPRKVLDSISLRDYGLVRWTSILSPFPVFLTWLICGWDTYKHAKAIWTGSGDRKAHDLAIQIIALPMVYSLMSLSATLRMWKIMSSNFFEEPVAKGDTFKTRRDHAMEIYEADYQIADLYEAWALHHFAVLAMQVLRRSFQSGGSMLERSGAALDTNSNVYQAWAGTLKGLHKSVRNLTMQGIWSFVIVCAVASMYGLTTPLLEEAMEDSFPEFVNTMRRNKDKARYFFLGTGCVASTAAICNILQIERTFHYELLHFKPFWKFWGTKVLVSIAFLQSLLFMLPIPPFRYMSTQQANLAYSTILCYECLLISLLHMHAWRADEDWYKEGMSEENANLVDFQSSSFPMPAMLPDSPADAKATEFGLRRAALSDESQMSN